MRTLIFILIIAAIGMAPVMVYAYEEGMIRAMNLYIDFASGEYREWYDPFLDSIGGHTMIGDSDV